MGCLLNFPIKFNPRRRWRSLYLGRQCYLSLLQEKPWSNGVICTEHYDDKYVVSCNYGHSEDYGDHAGRNGLGSDFAYEASRKECVNHDNNCDTNYGSNHNYEAGSRKKCVNDSTCDINYGSNHDYDNYHSYDYKSDSDYEASKDSIDSYNPCIDSYNPYRGVEEDNVAEDDGDAVALIRDYAQYQLHQKKRVVIVARRQRGLEGYWQRQAYLHSYKFTRRRSMRERAMVPVGKLRMAWGMMRGMYAKQARCVRRKLKAISNYAKFHHTSFLLLTKNYLKCPGSTTLSFKSSRTTLQFHNYYN